jgi:hypothetical protein
VTFPLVHPVYRDSVTMRETADGFEVVDAPDIADFSADALFNTPLSGAAVHVHLPGGIEYKIIAVDGYTGTWTGEKVAPVDSLMVRSETTLSRSRRSRAVTR